MKKICILSIFIGISSVYGMKKNVFSWNSKNFSRTFFTFNQKQSFFKQLKKENELLFFNTQQKIKNRLNANESPQDILYHLKIEFLEKKEIPNEIFLKKMLSYTIGAHKPLSYALKEMSKFGPNGWVLAGICTENQDKAARFNDYIGAMISFYQGRETPLETMKRNVLHILQESEALTIAKELNHKELEEIVKQYYRTFSTLVEEK